MKKRSIAERVVEKKADGVSLYGIQTGTADVVSLCLSVPGSSIHDKTFFTAGLAATLVDEGSKRHKKNAIREYFQEKGIEYSFFSSYTHSGFRLRALTKDIVDAARFAAELFLHATYPQKEIDLEIKRRRADLNRLEHDTYFQVWNALAQYWYGHEHIGYAPTTKEREAMLKKTQRRDLIDFRKRYYGKGSAILGVAGNTSETLYRELLSTFARMPDAHVPVPAFINGSLDKKGVILPDIHLPQKASVDVLIHTPLPLTTLDDDYLALKLGCDVLGVGFRGRLMQELREKHGLTYHTSAGIRSASPHVEGEFAAYASFSPHDADRATALMRKVVDRWVDHGITEDELRCAKEASIGANAVSFSSTSRFVSALVGTAEAGKPMPYIDAYPDRVNAVTKKQVNDAIQRYVPKDKLTRVRAGTLR